MTTYYKIQQSPNEYMPFYGVEHEPDMSTFLGYLNNNNVRKDFFKDAKIFERSKGDEFAAKTYVKENMTLKSIYHMGNFIYVLYDGDFVHVFSNEHFLTEQEKMDRTFKMALIKTKYSSLLNTLFTECHQERVDFFNFLTEGRDFFNNPEHVKDVAGLEKYRLYHSMLLSHMSRNKMNRDSLLYFPKLKQVIESEFFQDLKLDLKNNRASFYDLLYSKSHSGLAQFVNNYL